MSSTNALTMLRESIQKIASAVRTLVGDETAKYKFVELPDVISEKLVSKQKAIDAINATKTVGNGTKFTQAGMVSVQVSCSVNNHDNSLEDYIGCYINKNGSSVATGRSWISGWSGGSASCSKAFTVEAGDTVTYGYYGSSDAAICVVGSGSIVYTPNPF